MTITTLRPVSHNSGGNLALTGAASSTAALNDNSDSSYVRGQGDHAYETWNITTMGALTSTQRIKSAQLRIRNAADTGVTGYQPTLSKLLDKTDSTLAGVGNFTVQRGSTVITTYTGPITYKAPGNLPWTLARVNNLRHFVQWFRPAHGTTPFQRVHEIYCDIDVNEQPVITGAPVVTNFVDNARPTVTWVYTDLDGDPQTYARVRIFDSATYSSGGFNPATTFTPYDSLSLIGDAASYTTTFDLQNGVTYKAYVQVGQDWVPDHTTWLSDYGISAPFTVVFTPPYTPTLTAAVIADGQTYRTALTLIAPINLLTGDNADFEGNTIGTWVADTNMAAPIVSTADAAHGTHSLQLSSTAAGDMIARAGLDFLGDPAIDGGVQYTALASFHAATAGRSCQVGIRWLDITGATISTQFGASITDVTTAGVYTQAFFTGNAPGQAVNALAVVKVLATGGAAEIHRVDKVSLARGASTTWTPPVSTSAHTTYLERGERLDRRRGPADNWAHPQVASGGSVLRTHGFGFSWDPTKDQVVWEWLDQLIPGGGPPGMIHWMPRDPASSVTVFRMGTWLYYPETEWNFPVIVGQTQIGSLWAWVESGTLNVTPKIEWLSDTYTVLSTTTGTQVTLTTTPKQISVSGTVPASCSGARLLLSNDTGLNTADIYLTRIGWGLGTTTVDDKTPAGGPLVWTPVRFGEEGLGPAFFFGFPTGQRFRYNDYEMPPGRPVLYRARLGIQVPNIGNTTSPYTPYVPIMGALPPRTLLRSTTDPTLACAVNRRHMSATVGKAAATFHTEEDAQTFHPLGRDGGPVTIRDWIGGEDGELLLVTVNEKQADQLYALIRSSSVLIVQWAQGGLSYIRVLSRSFTQELHYFPWCDTDGNVISPYLRYDTHVLNYVETTAP